MTNNETAQHAPNEKASIRAVRAFMAKHPPAHGHADLFADDLIREAAYEVTSYMLEGLRGVR